MVIYNHTIYDIANQVPTFGAVLIALGIVMKKYSDRKARRAVCSLPTLPPVDKE